MVNNISTAWKEEYLNAEGKHEGGSEEQEQVFFDSIAIKIKKVVEHFTANNHHPMRANHAKIIAGFTAARFHVSNDLATDLQVGFLNPGKIYNAIVRFSNANGALIEDDSKPDLRGAAIRIQTENGDHDFLMTNAEEHHAKDAREAIIAIEAGVEKDIIADKIPGQPPGEDAVAGMVGALPYLIKHLGLKTGWRIAQTLKQQMKIPVESLSTETFWSRAPMAIGNIALPEKSIAIKYRLLPFRKKTEKPKAEKNLQHKLLEELDKGDVNFFLQVQRFINESDTPIEDSTKAWTSQFETIGELIIPQYSKMENEVVDNLMFSPWNIDLQNFRPIGSMNRSRKKAYGASVHARTHKQ